MRKTLLFLLITSVLMACQDSQKESKHRIMTLDPGHFHASLLQKSMLNGVDSVCYVFAPNAKDSEAHLALLEQYNARDENPTNWTPEVYTGSDFFKRMLQDRPGDIVVLAGNNRRKTEYIAEAINAGLSVLADKPMAIDSDGFQRLDEAFEKSESEGVLLYDIMTERYNIFSILQKELIHNSSVFGELDKGSPANPAIIKNSLHHFYKEVSGNPLRRPAWYYDVDQEGEGLVDVTTHAIDLVQWQLFPEEVLDYKREVEILRAERWPTNITLEQFFQSTGEKEVPAYLGKDQEGDVLKVFANGNMMFSLRGVHAQISVAWNYEAPEGLGDTHLSQIRGSRSTVSIRQGEKEEFKPTIYIEPSQGNSFSSQEHADIQNGIAEIEVKYPGITLRESAGGFILEVPEGLIEGHEEHFAQVADRFLKYLDEGKMPAWEKSFMLTKYFITTESARIADRLPSPPVH